MWRAIATIGPEAIGDFYHILPENHNWHNLSQPFDIPPWFVLLMK